MKLQQLMKPQQLAEARYYQSGIIELINSFIRTHNATTHAYDHKAISQEQQDEYGDTMADKFGEGYCDGDEEGGSCTWNLFLVNGELTKNQEPDADNYVVSVGEQSDRHEIEYVVDYYYFAIEKNP